MVDITYPLVEEGHKSIAFRLPSGHVFDHSSVPEGRYSIHSDSPKDFGTHDHYEDTSVEVYLRYPSKWAKCRFDVVCGDFRAKVTDKHMEMI